MHITADAPLWIASRAMISSRGDELMHTWELATKSYSLDAIHDLRVASRRLREAATLFASCYPVKRFSCIKTELKRLTKLLGCIRNTDEALLFFTPLRSSLPEPLIPSFGTYLAQLRRKRTTEHRYLEGQLEKMNLALVRGELRRALQRPRMFESSATDPFMPINQFFSSKLLEREIMVRQLLPESLCEQNIDALHRLRIALKKFRYAFELTAPIIKHGYKDLYAIIKQYQEVLGKIHDLDVFREMVREYEFNPESTTYLTELISSRRNLLYAKFMSMHTKHPVDNLGERARELL